jgi:transcription elongation factor GreA
MNKIPMTASGYEEIQNELKKLLNEDRPNIIAAIAEARSHGDLSENAEYQYAKEQQSLIEGKIADLENAVGRAEVIDVKSIASEEIKFGATIEIEDDESGQQYLYQIVGDYESDIKNKKLSVSSPLARGLINKTIDDVVEIKSPKGQKSYTIKSIKYV